LKLKSEFDSILSHRVLSLLTAYQADINQLSSVLDLLRAVDTNSVSLIPLNEIDEIGRLLQKMFLLRESESLLSSLVEYLLCLRSTFQESINQILNEIIEKLLASFESALNGPKFKRRSQDSNSIDSLMYRIFIIISKEESPEIISSFTMFTDFVESIESLRLSEDSVVSCYRSSLQIMYSILLWKINSLSKNQNESVEVLEEYLIPFFKVCEDCLQMDNLKIGTHAFRICGDFFLISDAQDLGMKGLITPAIWTNFSTFFTKSIDSVSEATDEAEILELFLSASKAVVASFEINMELCAKIISNYNRFGSSVDSLIRQLMAKLKSWDQHALLSAQLNALQIVRIYFLLFEINFFRCGILVEQIFVKWLLNWFYLLVLKEGFPLCSLFGMVLTIRFKQDLRISIFSIKLLSSTYFDLLFKMFRQRKLCVFYCIYLILFSLDYLKAKTDAEELSDEQRDIIENFQESTEKRISSLMNKRARLNQNDPLPTSELFSEDISSLRSDNIDSDFNMHHQIPSDILSDERESSEI
jgi:hypothetical protein